MFYSTKVVIDIETGAIESRDRVPYSGPWELGKESSAEKARRKALETAQTTAAQNYYNVDLPAQRAAEQERLKLERESFAQQKEQWQTQLQMMKDALAKQEAYLAPIKKSMEPYLTATEGFDPETKRLMMDESMTDIAGGYQDASSNLRSAMLSRGEGGGDQPTGGNYTRGVAELEGGLADTTSGARRTINLESLKQAIANKFNASSVLMGGAGMQGSNIGIGAGARAASPGNFFVNTSAPTMLAPPKPPSLWGKVGSSLLSMGAQAGMAGLGGGLSELFSNYFKKKPLSVPGYGVT